MAASASARNRINTAPKVVPAGVPVDERQEWLARKAAILEWVQRLHER